ncbi:MULTISPECIES: DNA-binding protein WhiA [unclassified Ruminococcus]|uniref:DNA-binding protein WhiA n=1 Tax=unclassified Ruminococcus TaxID=2608920 RepID=UPI00210D949F|nr:MULTISPECIES: DNA-binding protein WhiA [unclassified Ruminococcus]MCQ4022247.1 DNA-binding protein WhiA [Ruminococcus sp. zg-924]MCQ4114575.1 DNA-binding protein WhiA [Ruminococcus sp. zg-921]
MSFSFETKKELCSFVNQNAVSLRAECYGLLLFAKLFSHDNIIFNTENPYTAARFMDLMVEAFNAITEKKTALTGKKDRERLFTLSIPLESDCKRIFSELGHSRRSVSLRINRANLEDDMSVASFLRGAFLCCGSVSDPKKDYHLEFSVPYKNACNDLCRVISEVSSRGKEPKQLMRKGVYVAYIKDSEEIADLLALMGAPIASMNLMQEKILKSIRNDVNRKMNSEMANINKTAKASAVQLEAIEKIKRLRGLDSLPDDLRSIADLRIEYPEHSLRDLGEMLLPPISRSGANHRMKRILEIAENI